ncbi:MAG: alpha/beta hydrolase [Syntrophomonadaceae bacterium]|nr:alpha/beta hydrolase [Syntrophomonadaceae bacterium]
MEKIFIPVDGDQIIATLVFVPEGKSRLAVVICHGFRGTKENGGKIYAFADKLTRRGLMVAAFDFRGSGESSGAFGDMTLTQQVADLKQVCAYIGTRYQIPQILLGRSFGGSTVIAAAPYLPETRGYILWSAPFNLPLVFAGLLGDDYQRLMHGNSVVLSDEGGQFELKPSLLLDFKAHDMVMNLMAMRNKPVLVVHGKEDEAVAVQNACDILAHLPGATLHLVPGADHRFTDMVEHREAITIDWIDRHFVEG